MQITRTADYGVRLMTRLAAATPGTRMTVADLAHESGASVAFTGKILQRLAGARLVVSRRGYEGGFELARSADAISLLDIVSALVYSSKSSDVMRSKKRTPSRSMCQSPRTRGSPPRSRCGPREIRRP